MEHLNPKDCHSIQGGTNRFLGCIDPGIYGDLDDSRPFNIETVIDIRIVTMIH